MNSSITETTLNFLIISVTVEIISNLTFISAILEIIMNFDRISNISEKSESVLLSLYTVGVVCCIEGCQVVCVGY